MTVTRFTLTNDLHLDLLHLWGESLDHFLERLAGEKSLRWILVGDVVSFAAENLGPAFESLSRFPGLILYVPGNHDLWTEKGDSYTTYTEIIPELCARYGVHLLDGEPYIAGPVAVVGNVGWYDYSFRDPSFHFTQRQYVEKRLPSGFEWMDGRYIRWPLSDGEFTEFCCARLAGQLEDLPASVRQVIVVTHHIPFEELLLRKPDAEWAFGNAFMGSRRLGEIIATDPRVSHAFCGHSHVGRTARIGDLDACCLASNYRRKVLHTLDVDN